VKRQGDGGDDADQDDGWNRTGGSSASYVPSFGASGTLTNSMLLNSEKRLNSTI
jgi:hypothetical protein